MPEYDFRLRFHLHDSGRINIDDTELVIEGSDGKRLRLLTAGKKGDPIREHPRIAVSGGPYSSPDEARSAAERVKNAILIWSVRQKIGIDFGDGRPRFFITDYGLKMLEDQHGGLLRIDIHGIDVYEPQEKMAFVSMDTRAIVGKNPNVFIENIVSGYRTPIGLTEKQILAAELYCASFFDVSYRSRLITLVTAVEALLDPAVRSLQAQNLVSTMVTMVEGANIDNSTKVAMVGSLEHLKKDSIGQTGRALITQLLGDKEYNVLIATRYFAFCYDLRSQILHSGKPSDDSIDLSTVTNTCQEFVADLLLASFGVTE
jgi:hypothetical protein